MTDGVTPTAAPAWRKRDGAAVFAVAAVARGLVVAWAASRVPATADGAYYDRVARRIAQGLGYTWLWDDGAVTYAAHYPVGYPGAVGAVYALVGAHPAAAMILNALLGAVGALAVHALASRAGSRRGALAAGLFVALHPGLVMYTPALMTEGVTASLIACAAWAAMRLRDAGTRAARAGTLAALGVLVGLTTLVRPQWLVLAPLFAGLAAAGWSQAQASLGAAVRRIALAAAGASAVALLVCAPWTARNCVRMHRCALVSVNAGWNLLIGADANASGSWAPIVVPDACREVFGEAEKDACFGRAARDEILDHPAAWLTLVPRKLAATFDYCGAAGWYLHAANPAAFGDRAKIALGAIETVYERLMLLFALVWAARSGNGGRLRPVPVALAVIGGVFALLVHAWVGYVAFCVAALASPRALLSSAVAWTSVAAVATLALTHATFFGAGRYALMVFPLLCGVAGLAIAPARRRAHVSAPRAIPRPTLDFDNAGQARHSSVLQGANERCP